jgi:hypothetical protein
LSTSNRIQEIPQQVTAPTAAASHEAEENETQPWLNFEDVLEMSREMTFDDLLDWNEPQEVDPA